MARKTEQIKGQGGYLKKSGNRTGYNFSETLPLKIIIDKQLFIKCLSADNLLLFDHKLFVIFIYPKGN